MSRENEYKRRFHAAANDVALGFQVLVRLDDNWNYGSVSFYLGDKKYAEKLRGSKAIFHLSTRGIIFIRGIDEMTFDEFRMATLIGEQLKVRFPGSNDPFMLDEVNKLIFEEIAPPSPPWKQDTKKQILPMPIQKPMDWEIPKEELWWEKERREQKAAIDNMVAMRNAVRKITGL